MIIRIATLLLLCSASLPLLATEGHTAPDGEGGCPGAMVDERESAGAGPQEVDAASTSSDKLPARGGNAENSVRGPRMHNLLPGMFR